MDWGLVADKIRSSWVYNHYGYVLGAISIILITLLVSLAQHEVGRGMADISWPNCNRLPTRFYARAVIGVSGGLDFHPNPCLGNEARLAAVYGLYANTGDPGFPRIARLGIGPLHCRPKDLICYSYNYGYQAGLYALNQAKLNVANSSEWWLDVEAINSWTSSKLANRADISGMIAAIDNSSTLLRPRIGIYTAANQWYALVGHWQLRLPLWLGTGATSKQAAQKACLIKPIFDRTVLTQYTLGNVDYNYICTQLPEPHYFND